MGSRPIRSAGCRTSCRRAMTDRSVARTEGQSTCGSGHRPPAPTVPQSDPDRQGNHAHSQLERNWCVGPPNCCGGEPLPRDHIVLRVRAFASNYKETRPPTPTGGGNGLGDHKRHVSSVVVAADMANLTMPSRQPSPPVHRPGSGGRLVTRPCTRPCATPTSIQSVCPDSLHLRTHDSIEPPWYVTRMPGGVTGNAREGLPMSINTDYRQSP